MEFSVSKNKLLQATNLVKQAVATKATREILKTVYMKAEEGWLTSRGTDTNMYVSISIPLEVVEPGEVCIDSLVLNLLPTFADAHYKEDGQCSNPIKFKLGRGETKRLSISQGKSRHSPIYMDPAEFPKFPEVLEYSPISFEDKAKLVQAFQRLQVSVSDLVDRRILQGFHVNPHSNYIITGDGNRISLMEGLTIPGNIGTPNAKMVMSVLSNISGLSASDVLEVKFGNWTGFRAQQTLDGQVISKWEVIINTLAGEFPTIALESIQNAKRARTKLEVLVDKKALDNALSVCKIYSDAATEAGKINYAKLAKTQDGVIFSMEIPELVSDMVQPLDCEATGDDFEILLHPGTLLEALPTVKSEKVKLQFYGPRLPFLMFDLEEEKYTYLQVPMAANDTTG
ncbi:hypothetical protein C4577_01635 [Candidatus Parcubacteria bacterium]|nr:MAG: hypothetical protein C4577_01635 [Candidatus Parcubacteria bacterium]